MQAPESKQEVIQAAREYNRWIASGGKFELYPAFMEEEIGEGSLFKLIAGIFLHLILFYITKISRFLRMWWLVALLTKFRIATDSLGLEPRQCGFNRAYTRLGLIHLKKGRVDEAISCLGKSSLVYPCCHSSSFGLAKNLAMALEAYPDAGEAVRDYKQIYREFLGHQAVEN